MEALWAALGDLTSRLSIRRKQVAAVPVRIVADSGLVVYRGERGVYARKVDDDKTPDEEIFVMEEAPHEHAVSFGSVDKKEFLSARKSGIVELDDERSETALWEIEDMARGAMKLRNKSLGMYLRLEPSGKVSVQGNKIVHGTPLKVLHVLDWRSKKLRRSVVIISDRSRRFATMRNNKLELNSVARQVQDRDIFELEYNPSTALANIRSSSGAMLTSSGTEVVTGQHGWFTAEKSNGSFTLRGPQGYIAANSAGSVSVTQETAPGGANMFLLAVPPTNPEEAMDDIEFHTSVENLKGGAKLVKASISIPTHPKFPFQAVKDWSSLPNFVTKIHHCGRLEGDPGIPVSPPQDPKYLVEMTQRHSFMFFHKFDRMIVEAFDDPSKGVLKTRMLSSSLLRIYNCSWLAESDPSRKTSATLNLTVEFLPSIPIPGFIIDGLIQTDTRKTLVEVRDECIRRAKQR
mmetsp:Transcript_11982/g.36483  ORF Transcript_11982/g.36483 Transcript_11982/m.36483 type:complete len:461 (+) Transcript_11982:208-1590(+)